VDWEKMLDMPPSDNWCERDVAVISMLQRQRERERDGERDSERERERGRQWEREVKRKTVKVSELLSLTLQDLL
jgi:hypothetical protein